MKSYSITSAKSVTLLISIFFVCTNVLQSFAALSSHHLSSTKSVTGEVVGATGRIGSFLLKHDANYAAVPRKERPGTLTDEGCPIFVSVPATQISDVIKRTLPSRRNDLVFVTNGIPSDFLRGYDDSINQNEITASVPYFGVLVVGEDLVSEECSPDTIINDGRHGKRLAEMLDSSGVSCDIVGGIQEVDRAAIKKLIWISIMWLLCHDCKQGEQPIASAEVHKLKRRDVDQLLQELVPAANKLMEKFHSTGTERDIEGIGTIVEVANHLETYSLSMPTAIPNKLLAIDEFECRNGYLLSMEDIVGVPQKFHRQLVKRVVGYVPRYHC